MYSWTSVPSAVHSIHDYIDMYIYLVHLSRQSTVACQSSRLAIAHHLPHLGIWAKQSAELQCPESQKHHPALQKPQVFWRMEMLIEKILQTRWPGKSMQILWPSQLGGFFNWCRILYIKRNVEKRVRLNGWMVASMLGSWHWLIPWMVLY